jgi:tetratricopeptide (TPR) repeat protein
LIYRHLIWIALLALMPVASVFAQETTRPAAFQVDGFTHIPQGWNNCGPATLTMALTHYGFAADQNPAASWLKPNSDDGNVSPYQMVNYVNTQLAGTTRAINRSGGSLELAKTLLANGFPIIIEEGYDPEPDRLGWMGHYLLLIGYDDNQHIFTTHDSYLGPNHTYAYDHINQYWQHFNHTYIVVYDATREAELMALLGTDADAHQNALNALEVARQEALANPEDPFAWFNMGTNFVALEMYEEAVVAYDQARVVGGGLPWRMLWYQHGPYVAYNAVGRYQDTIELARTVLDGGGTAEYIEESYYYAGVAREGLGETERALSNYLQAININRNYTEAIEARDRLQAAAATSG